jgi:TolA-binding protein
MTASSRALLCLVLAATVTAARAQDAPRQALDAANNIYISGNYAEAVKAFEAVLKDYPTSTVVPNAQVQLAFAYYLTGENQRSLDTLKKFFEGPPSSAELTELATFLQAQATAALGAALPAGDAKRKTTLQDAVKKFNEFIQKFPQSGEIEAAQYGSALASFQAADYAAARTALEANLKRFPNSPSIAESQNLLALVLATQGSLMLTEDPGKRDEAFALYDQASAFLRDIIKKKTDLTLVNAAQFQLGEILLNQAAFAPDDRKAALLDEARATLRNVLPKAEVVALQQKKIDAIPGLRRAALQARNQAELKRIDRQAERDRRKLAELQSRPDQTVDALQKIGETYFQQGKYDEARVVLAHVAPLLGADAADDKKRNLYYTTMTYALQNAAEPAVKGYNAFQSAHKGDPIAANLPVAMGSLFLAHPDPAVRNPEKAAGYFKEAASLYPKSPLLGLAVVNEATARAQQGDFDGALKTYRDFLRGNPPPDTAAVAQLGIGNVLVQQSKWDEAIAAYKELTAKYPQAKQAEEAEFWIARSTQQKGDQAGAITLFEAFVQKHPDGTMTPQALFFLASAKLALGQNDEAVKLMADLAEKFPQSQPAPFTYFQRAQLAGAAQNADEVVRLMRQFVEKYPEDDKVFFAFDSIGQTETNRGNVEAAVAAYSDFVAKYPAAPKAPEAMLKIADLHRVAAERLGRFGALNPDEQTKWKESMAASTAAGEKMVADYADSPQLSLGLRALLAAKKLELDAGLTDAAGVEKYFSDLASSAPDGAKSKILFARAAFISEKDPARALDEMNKAYDAKLVYAPSDLDLYGLALIENGKTEEALAVFQKIAADYPIPEGVEPTKAPPGIQEAQAIAIFGQGKVAQKKGDVAGAGKFFDQLKQLYPWSPKMLEANYGIAEALRAQGKGDEAIALLTGIIRANNASSELRADSMLLGGYIMKEKGQRDAAIDYFIKISAFYDGVPEASATGLWEGGQLLEQQITELQASDPKKAEKQRAQVVRAYKELAEKFPESPFAPKAKERLTALGAK